MLKMTSGALMAGLLVCASAVSAQEEIPPAPDSNPAVGAPLYHCVKYKDLDNIAPCAVPTVVQVKDPCACVDPCCPAPCVSVEICAPPCPCGPRVTQNRDGSRVKYDYGKYQVEITSRNGVVTVDYDD